MQKQQTPPLVSVVVPAYNAAKHIEATLASLSTQSVRSIEILVIDDCSRDDTALIVQRCAATDERIRYLRMPHNFGGPAGPRNFGVEHARSEWIAFCDADDLWHPEKLSAQLACAKTHGAGLICTSIESFWDGTQPRLLGVPLDSNPPCRPVGLWQMLLKNRVATSSVLCLRERVRSAGGFKIDRELVAVEDYDLWLRLMTEMATKVIRVEQPLVAYRHLVGSLSANKFQQARKIMRVHKRVFSTKGWHLLFPLAAPTLIICYFCSWLYLRALNGRRN